MATKVKFRDMPLGGRFNNFGRVWVVLERYGDGLVASESLTPDPEGFRQSICSFVDSNAGITLDTEVNFIGLDKAVSGIEVDK